jgi:hypothetical protein
MPTRDYYFRQAQLLRDMAAVAENPDQAARWLKRAQELEALADAVGDMPTPPTPLQSQSQQQQQQQQQAKDSKTEC